MAARIRILQFETRVGWVLDDTQGSPLLIGAPRESFQDVLLAVNAARANAGVSERYRRGGNGFQLLDERGAVLGGRRLADASRVDAAIDAVMRNLGTAVVVVDPELRSRC